MHSRAGFYGWKLVAVLFALDFLNMGFPFFGGAVINTYMLREIPMSRSTYGLGFTLLNLFIGLPSLIVAAVILKWGARVAFAIGSALIFLGTLFLSLVASRPWHYLFAFGGHCYRHQLRDNRPNHNRRGTLVQSLPGKSDGDTVERFGFCRFSGRASDQNPGCQRWQLASGLAVF